MAVTLQRLVQHWWWIVWPALIGGGFALLCWLMSIWMGGMKEGVTGWWKSIEDPTERGGTYIATAIAAHAVVAAFKTFSSSVKIEK